MFKKAEKHQAKLRLAISGPSGSGKTYGALLLASGLGGKIAVIDTENGSASLYADLVPFDVVELTPPYSPERYIEALQAAEAGGYSTVIIDSLTHEWQGEGGCLQIADQVSAVTKNSYTAWAKVTPRHQALLDAVQRSGCHVIATMRSKQDYVLEDRNGKKTPRKIGLAPVQRDGIEYEWTIMFDLSIDGHLAVASKDRSSMFMDADPFKITAATGKRCLSWLTTGSAPAPQPQRAEPEAPPVVPEAPTPVPTDEPGDGWEQFEPGLSTFIERVKKARTRHSLEEIRSEAKQWCMAERDTAGWSAIDAASRKRLAELNAAERK